MEDRQENRNIDAIYRFYLDKPTETSMPEKYEELLSLKLHPLNQYGNMLPGEHPIVNNSESLLWTADNLNSDPLSRVENNRIKPCSNDASEISVDCYKQQQNFMDSSLQTTHQFVHNPSIHDTEYLYNVDYQIIQNTPIVNMQQSSFVYPNDIKTQTIVLSEENKIDSLIQSSYTTETQSNPDDTISSYNEELNQLHQPTTVLPCQLERIQDTSLFLDDRNARRNSGIKCQPRQRFRPRTHTESKMSSHFLRCEDGDELPYPAIYLVETWRLKSKVNFIQVTLCDINKQPHPYSLQNRSSQDSYGDKVLILKSNNPNELYFRVTDKEFDQGYKMFCLEFIKSKQGGDITKELIKSRELHKSILRFTRFYLDENDQFQEDKSSQEYSSEMTEHYGDVAVELVTPLYGLMNEHTIISVVAKGKIKPENLTITIMENCQKFTMQIKDFLLNGTTILFTMPPLPYTCKNNVQANIYFYYENECIHESTYLYLNLSDPDLRACAKEASIKFNDLMKRRKRPYDCDDNSTCTQRSTKRCRKKNSS